MKPDGFHGFCLIKMVPEAGLEPARVSPYAPQAYVSAISPPGLASKEEKPHQRGRRIIATFDDQSSPVL